MSDSVLRQPTGRQPVPRRSAIRKTGGGARKGLDRDPLIRDRVRYGIALDRDLYVELQKIASELQVSMSWLIQSTLREALKIGTRMDHKLDIKISVARRKPVDR